ncbi:hypothetical protein HI914_04554 [Erysiphe necator]|uniref:Uncharacterized protein n=1 Tax=Uncinula necator TaxID=52586 RepID=A0A0B1P8F8_UNCNE|nr:hypothetical protein HI914_04554 [Erysiphe necator]KHJ33630.1 hypothetical protein EV44_g4701 [Erysiphe necator]
MPSIIEKSLLMRPRPKISPYASPLIEIEFNETKNVYSVPRVLLQGQSWVSDDVDSYTCPYSEEVGHVLIHFLFTGEYQILEIDESKINEDKTMAELRIAVRVILVLGDWKCRGIQELVQSEIEFLSNSIHVFDVVRLVDEEFRGRTVKYSFEQEKWLKNFLVKRLNVAFEKNMTDFENFSLFDKLHNTDLIKFLAKNLLQTYYSRIPTSDENSPDIHVTESHEAGSTSAVTSPIPKNMSSDDLVKETENADPVT